jgi:hypothetical protein
MSLQTYNKISQACKSQNHSVQKISCVRLTGPHIHHQLHHHSERFEPPSSWSSPVISSYKAIYLTPLSTKFPQRRPKSKSDVTTHIALPPPSHICTRRVFHHFWYISQCKRLFPHRIPSDPYGWLHERSRATFPMSGSMCERPWRRLYGSVVVRDMDH